VRVVAILLTGLAACSGRSSCSTPLVTVSLDGHVFTVEVADDAAEQQRGLMGVTELAADEGMLFRFEGVTERTFWMKDTLIALDLIAIADDAIVSIAMMTPCEQALCPRTRTAPAGDVLEINAGRAASLGIEVGDAASVIMPDC
jgi:uncharacterized protein